ncbi:MAG TPA: GNAT family N-acetyltransferase [Gemmatimonadales bacterium]|nr:GNAT family N-acetyltransferase [Gemmatimonadales bacterium]
MSTPPPRRSVRIRDATPADATRLTSLLAALGYPADPDTVTARLEWLLAADPTARVIVAEVDGTVHGFATLHATPTLHRPTIVGRITGIAVAESSRQLGIGQHLVDAAEEHFRTLGAHRIEVTSGPTHAPAYDFYRHLGYEDAGVRFAKPLPRRDTTA